MLTKSNKDHNNIRDISHIIMLQLKCKYYRNNDKKKII